MADLAPEIAAIEKRVSDARAQAIKMIRSIQTECPHEKVVSEKDWGGGRRICTQCGLEEVNRYSWPGHTSEGGFYEFVRKPDQPTILNTEFFKRDDVVKYRVKV